MGNTRFETRSIEAAGAPNAVMKVADKIPAIMGSEESIVMSNNQRNNDLYDIFFHNDLQILYSLLHARKIANPQFRNQYRPQSTLHPLKMTPSESY